MGSHGQKLKSSNSADGLTLKVEDQTNPGLVLTRTPTMERDNLERSRNHSLRYLRGALTGDPGQDSQHHPIVDDSVDLLHHQDGGKQQTKQIHHDSQTNQQQINRQPQLQPRAYTQPGVSAGVLKQPHLGGTLQQLQPPAKLPRPHSCHVVFNEPPGNPEVPGKSGTMLKSPQSPAHGSQTAFQSQYQQQLQQHVNEKLHNYPQQQQHIQRNHAVSGLNENSSQKPASPILEKKTGKKNNPKS